MEQGLGSIENRNETPLISNIDAVTGSTGYILTRDNNNEIVATAAPGPIISNIETVTDSAKYVITRNENDEVIVEEETAKIQNLDEVNDNERYHITRRVGNVLAISDRSIQIPTPNQIFNFVYGLRANNNNFFITRVPALTDYVFSTNSLQNNALFSVEGEDGSRNIHVCNTSGKIIKFGLLHVTQFRSVGLIDRGYLFEIIINNINQNALNINLDNSVGNNENRTRSMDIENLNLFVNQGDSLGLRYLIGSNGRTGDYCQVRLTVDTNARRDDFGNPLIP